MFKIAASVVIALIAALLIFASTRPDSFRVQRTITIKAAPEKVFPLINDFHLWAGWSPWEKLDPAMQRTYSGAASGVGSAYAWKGNSKVGAGGMEVTSATPSSRIVIKLDFLVPFEAHNTAEFTLKPVDNSTEVTWAMYGPSPFISKLMGVFFSMDQMIGKDFETGLANLKVAAEK